MLICAGHTAKQEKPKSKKGSHKTKYPLQPSPSKIPVLWDPPQKKEAEKNINFRLFRDV